MGPPLQKVLDLPPHPPQCAPWGTFPPRGRLSGGTMCAPTAETDALTRQSQALFLNRSDFKFCRPRAQWPSGNLGCHSDFARRK